MMTYEPLKRALIAAGATGLENAYLYQDYLYELLAEGDAHKAVTEQQWDMICDMQGKRRLQYASNINTILRSVEK